MHLLLETSPRAEGERETYPGFSLPFPLQCPIRDRLLGLAPPAPSTDQSGGQGGQRNRSEGEQAQDFWGPPLCHSVSTLTLITIF